MAVLGRAFRILFFVFIVVFGVSCNKKPHLIVILADDMGWNDVGFHGADQIPTPNIDALAYNGIILNSHYSQSLCTPSRAAFLTGKYPIHTGMQHLVLLEPEPRGLPLEEKLMPEYLREAGYATHAVGKWHLGFYKTAYTPTLRGFDTHFGYWNGLQDYYTHNTYATYENMSGYDMRRNLVVDRESRGKYSTTLFTDEAIRLIKNHNNEQPMFMYLSHLAPHSGNRDDPLQAPDEEIAKFAHISDPNRRIYAAMVSMLDKGIGDVIAALREKGMLENSIVVLMSDNGAQSFGVHANYGSNYPLKGMKATPWEGGMRTYAAIWSPFLKTSQHVYDEVIHMTDWLPTLYAAAGLSVKDLREIDGVNMWDAISHNLKSPRLEMVYNIDDIFNYAAIRRGDWKYVLGTISDGSIDGWYGDTGSGPQYEYDTSLVLKSKVATAIAGVITKLQIKEKAARGAAAADNKFSKNLLTEKIILRLRNESTIRCPEINNDGTSDLKCNPLESPCLFNLREDPCERINLASERPIIVKNLENALVQIRKSVVKASNLPTDSNADPARWNDTWVPWQDCEFIKSQKIKGPLSNMTIGILALVCMLFFVIVMILIAISVKSSSAKKKLSTSHLFANQDDALDSPNGVIHVITDNTINKANCHSSDLHQNG